MAGEILAARREDDVDELRLAFVVAVGHPLKALRAVVVLGRRLAELDALDAAELEPAHLVNFAVGFARLRAVVEGFETYLGGEVRAHRRDVDD